MASDIIEGQLRQVEDVLSRFQRVVFNPSVVKGFGLTASQVFIMRFLDNREHAKASDIAKAAGLSPGAVTQVCDELVRLDFAKRTRSDDDRRVVYIAITGHGREQLNRIRMVRSERIAKILNRLGKEDSETFLRIMNRVVEIVESGDF